MCCSRRTPGLQNSPYKNGWRLVHLASSTCCLSYAHSTKEKLWFNITTWVICVAGNTHPPTFERFAPWFQDIVVNRVWNGVCPLSFNFCIAKWDDTIDFMVHLSAGLGPIDLQEFIWNLTNIIAQLAKNAQPRSCDFWLKIEDWNMQQLEAWIITTCNDGANTQRKPSQCE